MAKFLIVENFFVFKTVTMSLSTMGPVHRTVLYGTMIG